MSVSPAATLAAQLRALAVRATEQSSPVHLGQVLAESLGVVVGALEEADRVVGAAISDAFASLPLTEADREALRAAGLPVPAASAASVDQVLTAAAPDQLRAPVPTVSADQVIDAGPNGLAIASALHGLNAEEFEQAVANARAILFGQVEG